MANFGFMNLCIFVHMTSVVSSVEGKRLCAGLHGATEPGFRAVPADPCLLFMPALYQIGLDCIKGLVTHVVFDAAGIVYSGLFIHAEGYEKL